MPRGKFHLKLKYCKKKNYDYLLFTQYFKMFKKKIFDNGMVLKWRGVFLFCLSL